MTPEFIHLITAFFFCNAQAEIAPLPLEDAQLCVGYQTAIKFELLRDTDAATYQAMSSAERFDFDMRGYHAYRAWLAENPEFVSDLMRDAREHVRLAQSAQ
ncbi:hypothetical protein N6L24_01030 [Cognatishimia sp. SS12]|uniref:hypothetical protein n=1 Tax=Cognatishimia sp. SS12 TaxID=2979465 RepID=UPI00232AD86F|nr:hypothetical protein [Cognatishimia sp. SS12]MDC0736849.1 hypothetical protein [Cognatishimia sp. SS12]